MNTLYYSDNLNILRRYGGNTRGSKCVTFPRPSAGVQHPDTLPTGRVSASSDPPFNSNRNYNVLFKDESGLEADSLGWLSRIHGIGKVQPVPVTFF